MTQENKKYVGGSLQNEKNIASKYTTTSHKYVLADAVYCNFSRKPDVEMNSWKEVYFYNGVA